MQDAPSFSIGLDVPFGCKSLYVNDARLCEFFSYTPEGWQQVLFPSLEEAESFVSKHYGANQAVYIAEKI